MNSWLRDEQRNSNTGLASATQQNQLFGLRVGQEVHYIHPSSAGLIDPRDPALEVGLAVLSGS